MPPSGKELFARLAGSEFLRKVAETLVTRGLLILLGLANSVIVARALGPEGRGLYAVATAVSGIAVQFGTLGLHSANTVMVASEPHRLPRLLGNSIVVCVLAALVAVLIDATVLPAEHVFSLSGVLKWMTLGYIPFGLMFVLTSSLLMGLYLIRAANIIDLATRIAATALLLLLAMLGAITVETAFLTSVATIAAGAVWGIWLLMRRSTALPRPSLALAYEQLGFGVKAYLANLFGFVVLRSSILVVQHELGAEATGYFSIAVTMIDMLMTVGATVGIILLPRLASMTAIEEKWVAARRALTLLTVLAATIGVVSLAVAAPLVRLMFGVAFLPAVSPFLLMLPGVLFLSMQVAASQFLASVGLPFALVAIVFLAAAVNLTIVWTLIDSLGLSAPAIGYSCAGLLTLILMTILAYLHSTRHDG